eukprot:118449_1
MATVEIQLAQQMDDNEKSSKASAAPQTNPDEKLDVLQSWKHDKRAFTCDIVRWVLVGLITCIYLGFEAASYNDQATNSITTSTLEPLSEYATPYFAFYTFGNVKNLTVEAVNLFETSDYTKNFTQIPAAQLQKTTIENVANFQYGPASESWQLLQGAGPFDGLSILVPPFGQTLVQSTRILIQLSSYSACDYYWMEEPQRFNKTLIDDPREKAFYLQIQQFLSDEYGIYWVADSVEYLANVAGRMLSFDLTGMEYTFVASRTLAHLSLVEQINEWNNTKHYFYETKIAQSALNARSWASKSSLNQYCWRYTNSIAVRMSASAGGNGLKKVIVISRRKSIIDILSGTGGIFSPLLKGMTTLFVFCLGAFCAQKQGWSEKEKLKTALYLKELELLTNEKYEEALQRTEDIK